MFKIRLVFLSFLLFFTSYGDTFKNSLQSSEFNLKIPPASEKLLVLSNANTEIGSFHLQEKFRIVIPLSIREGWHIYSLQKTHDFLQPTRLQFTSYLEEEGPAYETKVHDKYDKLLEIEIAQHEKNVTFYKNFSCSKYTSNRKA